MSSKYYSKLTLHMETRKSQIDCIWVSILDEASWFTLKELKCLVVVCMDFFCIVKRKLEANYYFTIVEKRVLHYFKPKKVRVCPHSIIPPSVSIINLYRTCITRNKPLPLLFPPNTIQLTLGQFKYPLTSLSSLSFYSCYTS